jgi:chemotaxis protein MotB
VLPVGNTEPDDFELLRKRVERALSGEIAQGEVGVRVTPEGLVISLREVGFFDSGSANIRPSSRPAFDRLAAVLQSANTDLRVEGHTDDVPIRNAHFASNWDLSTARATNTLRLLLTKYNFAPDRLAVAGYAQYRPVSSNGTADGRAMNRRVDIVVPRKPRPI